MLTEESIQKRVDEVITRFKTTPIQYFEYINGVTDIYGQTDKEFSAGPFLTGRAIHRPTAESVTIIGQGEVYEIAFLFSRLEMLRKFPSGVEGEWMDASGRMRWRERDYKIEKIKPSGQVGETFSLFIAVANSLLGNRDT